VSLLQTCDEALTGHAATGAEVSLDHVDRLVGVVAARQDSLIAWEQLRHLGLGRGAIEHRVRRGLLHRLHPGVFCWGTLIETPWMRARAALYACGRGSIVTHDAACGLMAIRQHPAGAIDITVIGRRVRRTGIRAHDVDHVARGDVREIRGIPVSSPARALIEIAPRLTTRELGDAVEQAQIKRLVTKQDIERAIERAGPRPGVVALRAFLEEPAFTRSRAERRVVALLRAAQLPRPEFNAHAEGYEVDALWRRERVVLEYDSYEFHRTKAALVRDRAKTAALQRARYTVLRTTWVELTKQSHALIARTAEALALSTGLQRT
jgi:very-short-patch-repair endonuclease